MLRQWKLNSWLKWSLFIFCSKQPWPTKLVFYINSSFLNNCTKHPHLQQSIHKVRKKQGHCVQGDYKHIKTKPISPEGVFCSGVYYTRENTYKDCYIRQECSQGAFRTSTGCRTTLSLRPNSTIPAKAKKLGLLSIYKFSLLGSTCFLLR